MFQNRFMSEINGVNPDSQILENSSKNISKISVFRIMCQSDFMKNSSIRIWVLFSFSEILKSVIGWVFQKSVCLMRHQFQFFYFRFFLVLNPNPGIQPSHAQKSLAIKNFRSRRISISWSTQVHGLICKPADQKSSASKSRTVKYPRFSQGPITELYSWWPTDRDLNNQVVFKIFIFIFYSWEHLITLARRLLEKSSNWKSGN